LSYKDWNQSPLTEKRFSRVFDPPSYNYFDYQNVWYRIMCDPNPKHSWYISFKNPLNEKILVWFQEWFCWAGPTKSIFPLIVVKFYEDFKKATRNMPIHEIL